MSAPPSSRAGEPVARTGLATGLLLAAVHAYRLGVSPVLGPACRFVPSCSAYAEEALRRHGALRGSLLAARRVGRCHPFHAGGYDPVPPGGSLGGT